MTAPLPGEYAPSPIRMVRDQVALYEASSGADGAVSPAGEPLVLFSSRGAKSGKVRKALVVRVERAGRYALVASFRGADRHPQWYYNIVSYPHVVLQDGPRRSAMVARELEGAEREEWWKRAVSVCPAYAEHQSKTARRIPLLLLEATG